MTTLKIPRRPPTIRPPEEAYVAFEKHMSCLLKSVRRDYPSILPSVEKHLRVLVGRLRARRVAVPKGHASRIDGGQSD